MNDDKKLQTYIYVEAKPQNQEDDMELYVMYGASTDEFFLRVYMSMQCIYGEYMIPCKSLPQQTQDGRMFICFVTQRGFLSIAKRFLMKIPMQHRLQKDFSTYDNVSVDKTC